MLFDKVENSNQGLNATRRLLLRVVLIPNETRKTADLRGSECVSRLVYKRTSFSSVYGNSEFNPRVCVACAIFIYSNAYKNVITKIFVKIYRKIQE